MTTQYVIDGVLAECHPFLTLTAPIKRTRVLHRDAKQFSSVSEMVYHLLQLFDRYFPSLCGQLSEEEVLYVLSVRPSESFLQAMRTTSGKSHLNAENFRQHLAKALTVLDAQVEQRVLDRRQRKLVVPAAANDYDLQKELEAAWLQGGE